MSECIQSEFDAYQGTTVTSPQFFEVEETLPEDITADCIKDGIRDGTYTPVKLSDYTYEAHLRKDYNSPLVEDLELEIHVEVLDDFSYDFEYMTFTIKAIDTKDWDNKEHSLKFDILRIDEDENGSTEENVVNVWVEGSINVKPTITEL